MLQVKPSAASIVGGYAAAAKPATPSTATAAAPATPVTPTELGVEFEKLKFTPTLHVTSAQYNAKMEDEIKVQCTFALPCDGVEIVCAREFVTHPLSDDVW